MTVSYQQGVDSAIVLNYGTADQAVVKGLGKLGPPGMTRSVITVDEFRNDFARKFSGGGEYGDITFGGNFVVGDEDGQQLIKEHLVSRAKLSGTDILFFLDYDNFFATDLANDANAAFQITGADIGEADKNGIYSFDGVAISNGRVALYSAHFIDGAVPTIAFVQGSGSEDTITDSDSGFVTAGFKAGMSLMIVKSTSNDAVHVTILTVAAGTLTLNCEGVVTAEAAVEGTELHGGTI